MKVTLADTAGFCFGVQRAVDTVERTAGEGSPVVTLGPIVHNRHVVTRFEALGVREAGSVEEIPQGATVIIRAHGVGRETYQALEARGLRVVDATCPFVDRIHRLVRRAEEEGRKPVIFGSKTHPEVVGICGWCRDPLVVESPEEFEKWLQEDPKRAQSPWPWRPRPHPIKICGKFLEKSQKKYVQIAKYLIQYAKRLKIGKMPPRSWPPGATPWWWWGTKPAPIPGSWPPSAAPTAPRSGW